MYFYVSYLAHVVQSSLHSDRFDVSPVCLLHPLTDVAVDSVEDHAVADFKSLRRESMHITAHK
jgi:hypothetical protein